MGTTWAAAVVEVLRAQAQAYRVLETVVSKKNALFNCAKQNVLFHSENGLNFER